MNAHAKTIMLALLSLSLSYPIIIRVTPVAAGQTSPTQKKVFPSQARTPSSGITSSGGPLASNPAIFIGEVRIFAFGDDASIARLESQGWLPCEGQSLDNNTTNGFPELAAALQANWGSEEADAAHVFNVPDMRGMFLRGRLHGTIPQGDPAGDPEARYSPRPDSKFPGASAGVGSYQPDGIKTHSHPGVVAGPSAGEKALLYGGELTNGLTANRWQTNQSGAGTGAGSWWARVNDPNTQPSGGGAETRGKNVAVLFAIYTGRKVIAP